MKKTDLLNQSGISLIEVLLVIFLISILGSFSFSLGARTLEDYKLNKAAKILVADLRETREKALTENVWQQFKVFAGVNKYRISKVGAPVQDVQLEKGVTFLTGNLDLSFYPSGTPSGGTTIVLCNRNGKQARIIIAPVTGRIRLSS